MSFLKGAKHANTLASQFARLSKKDKQKKEHAHPHVKEEHRGRMKLNIKETQSQPVNINEYELTSEINADSRVPSSPLQNESKIRFNFHLQNGYTKGVFLRCNIDNRSNYEATVSLAKIVSVQVYASSRGNMVIHDISNEAILTNLTIGEWGQSHLMMEAANLTDQLEADTLAANTNQIMFVHLPTFMDMGVWGGAVQDEISVVVNFLSGESPTADDENNLELDDIRLIVRYSQPLREENDIVNARFRKQAHHYRFLNPVTQRIKQADAVASTRYTLRLNQKGLSAFDSFVWSRDTLTETNAFPVASYVLHDADGNEVGIETDHRFAVFYDSQQCGSIVGSDSDTDVARYFIPHSLSPVDSLREGGNTGYFSYATDETLEILTDSTQSTEDMTLVFTSWIYNMITVEDGHIRLLR